MIQHLKIDDTDIYLDYEGEGTGKITISNSFGKNYSHYWGAMGDTLPEFIQSIDEDYFTSKLLGAKACYTFCAKSTFKNVRDHIKTEMNYNLPWYKHIEFQKDMRYEIKKFQNRCENSNQFVDGWYRFVDSLPYYNIEDILDRKEIEKNFKNISEPWYFISEKLSEEYKWLVKLFHKLKSKLNDTKKQEILSEERG